jgi:serine O-acetyltransferase
MRRSEFKLSSAPPVKSKSLPAAWFERLPRIFSRAAEDVSAVCANDPAARSIWEVALLYPGLHALWLHRAAHELWTSKRPFAARLVSHFNRFATGIEIHPAAEIGRRVVIDHGMGIVIGETAKVGDDCLLYKGIVLGGTTKSRGKRHPTLGNHVVVGSNACILGSIEVGSGARVGSGSVVIRPVPANATVVGVPARIIVPAHARFDAALDHANLPDPVSEMLRALAGQNQRLRDRVALLERKLGLVADDRESEELMPFDGDELPPLHGG